MSLIWACPFLIPTAQVPGPGYPLVVAISVSHKTYALCELPPVAAQDLFCMAAPYGKLPLLSLTP